MGFWTKLFGVERKSTELRDPGLARAIVDRHPAARVDSPGLSAGSLRQSPLRDLPLVVEYYQSVNGETHYQPALRAVCGGRVAQMTGDNWESAIRVRARLIPEPANKYDRNAVVVQVDGRTVGYLPRSIAGDFQPPLLRLAEVGRVATCEGRIVGGGNRYYGIFLKLCAPATVDFQRQLPPEVDLVFGTATVTVTGEENHQDVLAAHPQAGTPDRRMVTLHSSTMPKGKHRGDYTIEVRMNRARVGCLTAAMGQRYRDVVIRSETLGRTAGALAIARQDARGWQVELMLPSLRELAG